MTPEEVRAWAKPITAARKRPWFQLHLTTCVVLTIVGAVLIWLNLAEQISFDSDTFAFEDRSGIRVGWPRCALFAEDGSVYVGGSESRNSPRAYESFDRRVIYDWLLPDVSAAVGLLASAALLCEWSIKRRTRYKS